MIQLIFNFDTDSEVTINNVPVTNVSGTFNIASEACSLSSGSKLYGCSVKNKGKTAEDKTLNNYALEINMNPCMGQVKLINLEYYASLNHSQPQVMYESDSDGELKAYYVLKPQDPFDESYIEFPKQTVNTKSQLPSYNAYLITGKLKNINFLYQ